MVKERRQTGNNGVVTHEDYALLAGFRHALREFIRFSEEAAGGAGVPPHQHQAMLVIKGLAKEGRLTVGDLATSLQIRHQSAVGLVNRMAARGLARKKSDPRDHRHMLLHLTSKGERILAGLSAAHKAELSRVVPALQAILTQLQALA
jgi:DNA-binding MarR family transcriptional regulator